MGEATWPLQTQRLSIRPARADDLAATWRFRHIPSVGEWISRAPTSFEAYAAAFLDPDRLGVVYVVECEGAIVGDLMLRIGDAWGQAEVAEQAQGTQAELGWAFDPAVGGGGLATEAVDALIGRCFDDLGLRRVTAACFAANTASWRLMERVGMRREAHHVANSLHRSGAWLDGYSYALLAEEQRPSRTNAPTPRPAP